MLATFVSPMNPVRDDICTIARDHYDAVFRFCARRVGPDAAEDAAQDTFVTAHRVLRKFRGASSLRTWLFGIALNECRRIARQRRIEPSQVPLIETASVDDADRLVNRRALQDALAKLSPEHRDVVLLHEIEGLTYDEISTVLGVPSGTVKSRLHHAFQHLRRLLSDATEGATR